jgi:hypothetical protein
MQDPIKDLAQKLNLSSTLPDGSDEEVQNVFNAVFKKAVANLRYINSAETKQAPFSKQKIEGKDYLFLPSNYKKLYEDPAWQVVLLFLNTQDYILKVSDIEVPYTKTNEQQRLFWAGYVNRLMRGANDAIKNLNFTGTIPSDKGRACADAEVFLTTFKNPSASNYLPDTVKFGEKKGKYVNSQIALLGGAGGLGGVFELPMRLSEVTKHLIDKTQTSWKRITDATSFPYGRVISSLSAKKKITKMVDGKKVESIKSIHLVQPSKVIEALLDSDQQYLTALDEPWSEMKKLSDEYANKGVPSDKLVSTEQAYESLYRRQKENSEKLTSWRASRRQAIKEALKIIHPKKTPEYKAAMKADILSTIAEAAVDKDYEKKDLLRLDSFSPRHLTSLVGVSVYEEYTKSSLLDDKTGILRKAVEDRKDLKQSIITWAMQFDCNELVARYNKMFEPLEAKKQVKTSKIEDLDVGPQMTKEEYESLTEQEKEAATAFHEEKGKYPPFTEVKNGNVVFYYGTVGDIV